MRKLTLPLLTSIALISMTSTYAGNRADTATLSVGAGYDYFAPKREIKNTSLPFVEAGYNFTDQWGIRGLLSLFTTHFKKSVGDTRQIDGTLVLVDGVYHLPPHKFFEPYVIAGVGAMGLNPNQNEAHNEGNMNGGLGAEFFIDKSIAFRLEARDIYTLVGTKNDVLLNAGMTFLFDVGSCRT